MISKRRLQKKKKEAAMWSISLDRAWKVHRERWKKNSEDIKEIYTNLGGQIEINRFMEVPNKKMSFGVSWQFLPALLNFQKLALFSLSLCLCGSVEALENGGIGTAKLGGVSQSARWAVGLGRNLPQSSLPFQKLHRHAISL